MKTIVTHCSVDLDAITSIWLIKRFLPEWKDAELKFVSAGSTLNDEPADANKEIIHVDTGMGKFDHHQNDNNTCATKLVFEFLKENFSLDHKNIKALERMVSFVNDVDHFQEVYYPEPCDDRYEFLLSQIIETLKSVLKGNDEVVGAVFPMLDAELQLFKNKIRAEHEIKKGFVFHTKWGKAIAMETKNEESLKLAQKSGFTVAVRKDPERGFLRIKSLPKKNIDLTPVYEKLKHLDKKATWFLHASKNMLLNGSAKNPKAIPTIVNLKSAIEILKKI